MKTERFSTPKDINGNRFQVEVDYNNKTFRKGHFLFVTDERADTLIIKKELMKHIDKLLRFGFTEERD